MIVRGREQSANPTYNCYRCKGDGWVQLLGLETRRHLPVLVEALGMSAADKARVLDAQFDPAQLRQQSVREEITSTLDAAFMQKDADEWVEIFEATDVWHHKVMDINEVALAPQPNAVGAFTEVPGQPIRQVAHPVKFSVSEHAPTGGAPELGWAPTLTQAEMPAVLAVNSALMSRGLCDGASAFLGITTAGFPNLFMLYGPNTHNGSILEMIEYQTAHVLLHVKRLAEEDLAWVDVKPAAQAAYNERVQEAIAGVSVWNHDVNGYYRSKSGRVVTQWPFSMTQFEDMTAKLDPNDYEVG